MDEFDNDADDYDDNDFYDINETDDFIDG